MILIRNARSRDYPQILKLARFLNSYNLPYSPKSVRNLLRTCERSFAGKASSSARRFMFVAEETRTGRIVGCSLIIARHGTAALPHVSFRVGMETRKSFSLRKTMSHYTLSLQSDSKGFTEIGGLVVLPAFRRTPERIGKQLSYIRFAYMALHRAWFRPRLLVEYLPHLDPQKGNRLWTSLGQKFTGVDYRTADRLSGRSKEFILSLFPDDKIYCCLLPEEAIQSIGVPGRGAERSLRMLERLGFRFLGHIDPFDGGPHYGASFSGIPLIKSTRSLRYQKSKMLRAAAFSTRALVMNVDQHNLRAVLTPYHLLKGRVALPKSASEVLKLKEGKRVSLTPFDL